MEKHETNTPTGEYLESLHDGLKNETQLSQAKDATLARMLDVEITPQQERKVLFKLDLILIPLMGICYMMQYMDKLALSQATLFNIREDLNLEGQQYTWTSAIFYFGYLIWSPISSYLIVRLPLGKYVTASALVWGGVLMCHAAAKNFNGLMATRFFLGVGEASIAPGFSLITGMFYKREEQPARQSAWFFGNCISTLIGGVVSWGIVNIESSAFTRWQLLFLVLGGITAGIGFFLLVLLPDTPKNAIFLTKTERAIAVQRTLKNKTGTMDTGSFKWDQAWLAVRDPQTWLIVLYTFSVNLCNGGITSFASILINSFGFSHLRSLLMQMPLGASQIIFLAFTAAIATFVPKTRILMMILNTVTSMVGMILVWKLDENNKKGRLTGLSLGAVFGVNIPLSLSIISSNVAGFTKRSTTSAMLFVAYCVGNIVGPQFFLESEEPQYPTGMKGAISGLALGTFFLCCLIIYYVLENRRRDLVYGPPSQLTDEEERQQGLLNKTDLEIESFRYVI